MRTEIAPWAELVGDCCVTAEELMQLPEDGWQYELIEGRLIRVAPTGGAHGLGSGDLAIDLGSFVRARGLGRILINETGFVISAVDEPETVLAPDVAFVRTARIPPSTSPEYEKFWRIVPDLVVEFASPSQGEAEMAAKAERWARAGVPLVWLVMPRSRSVGVWKL